MTTSSTQQTTSQQSAPWTVQQPYLKQAFDQAQGNLSNANANQYTGQQIAQFTPEQLANFQQMQGYGSNPAGANTSTNVGIDTANAGSSALQDALNGLKTYTPGGGTQSNIDAATAYANNPATQGLIDAAMRDANRSVSEQALPQIARGAATSGNTMSSRRAISEGLVERGLAEKTADVSANIRGQQFNNGLALAEQGRQSDNSAILDALKSSASAGGNAVNSGVNSIGSGIQQQGGLFDIANAGAAGGQQNQQNQIDNAKGMAEYGSDTAAKNLQAFMSIVGSNQWGGQMNGSTTETSTPSTWNTIASGLGILNSFMKLSDRRMKQDIRCIGQADNGLPIYTFRYLNDPKREVHMGFIAQDVEKVRPEAVVEVGGLKHVNYELAGSGAIA
jgi:hypothetical protein